MKKQIRSTLTKLGVMIALTLGITAVTASAQSYDHIMANIPFEFTVGGKALPAGAYTVRRVSVNAPYLFVLRGKETQVIANGFANALQAGKASAQTKLVFHRYGDRYFLSEIWIDGDDVGHQLPKSRAERELSRETAGASSRPGMVAVIAGHL